MRKRAVVFMTERYGDSAPKSNPCIGCAAPRAPRLDAIAQQLPRWNLEDLGIVRIVHVADQEDPAFWLLT